MFDVHRIRRLQITKIITPHIRICTAIVAQMINPMTDANPSLLQLGNVSNPILASMNSQRLSGATVGRNEKKGTGMQSSARVVNASE